MTPDRPSNDDGLFDAKEGCDSNAYLGTGAGDWDAYAQAFKLAAETLVEHIGESRMHLDLLVFPIVFLYRQYLELRLKDLIQETTGLDNEDRDTHDLTRLWRKVRPELQKVFPTSTADFDVAEQKIKQFTTVDPGSFTFRYPEDKKGSPTLPPKPKWIGLGPDGALIIPPSPPGLRQIDLLRLREGMSDLAQLLDGCSIAIYDSKRDG